MAIDWSSRVVRTQLTCFVLLCFCLLLMLIATLTPAWQVADDVDANQYVQSGLWMYCPGSAQCWYIFNDDAVNFYEKTKVCRFFLFGDCRKKLVRTPYFFSWHKAVFIVMLFALVFGLISAIILAISLFGRKLVQTSTILFNILTFLTCKVLLILLVSIGLAVFVTNAEMLESKYHIGVKQTFRKEYGYSFYVAGISVLFLLFSLLGGITLVTYVFFSREKHDHSALPGMEDDEMEWKRRNFIERMQEPEPQFDQPISEYSFPVLEQQLFDHPPRPGSLMNTHTIISQHDPEFRQPSRIFESCY
ncbi:unnamed protein product [Enterobius vermicularis]|uniref:C-type lectin domain-containing protein n=1 Tax=Enterobius vermicularis TaxID=51028 RepID=A0A158QAW5_ENTVE|nr:unnamed protein product [Enterobius vermicularis]